MIKLIIFSLSFFLNLIEFEHDVESGNQQWLSTLLQLFFLGYIIKCGLQTMWKRIFYTNGSSTPYSSMAKVIEFDKSEMKF